MTKRVSNNEDILDSRDVQTRIEELESEIEDAEDHEESGAEFDADDVEENKKELATLEAFKDEAVNATSEWDFGATLISAGYFETYARQFAEEIGSHDTSASWPMNCIDWAQAAAQLQQDYSSVDFDGQEFFVLST